MRVIGKTQDGMGDKIKNCYFSFAIKLVYHFVRISSLLGENICKPGIW